MFSNNGDEMREPLQQQPSSSSQAPRGALQGSLLERIQKQREREASVASKANSSVASIASNENLGSSVELPTAAAPADKGAPPTISQQAPSYSPLATSHDAASMDAQEGGGVSNAWSGFTSRIQSSMDQFGASQEATETLLGPEQQQREDGYSMTGYFQTFVQDVYGAFRSLPIWGQGVLVFVLLFLAFKLL